MNEYLIRLNDQPGQILAHFANTDLGVGYAVHQSNYGPVRLITYDLDEAIAGADCVVGIQSWLLRERAIDAFRKLLTASS